MPSWLGWVGLNHLYQVTGDFCQYQSPGKAYQTISNKTHRTLARTLKEADLEPRVSWSRIPVKTVLPSTPFSSQSILGVGTGWADAQTGSFRCGLTRPSQGKATQAISPSCIPPDHFTLFYLARKKGKLAMRLPMMKGPSDSLSLQPAYSRPRFLFQLYQESGGLGHLAGSVKRTGDSWGALVA